MPQSPALTPDSAIFVSAAQNLLSAHRFEADIGSALARQPKTDLLPLYMPGYATATALLLGAGLTAEHALYVLTVLGWLGLVSLTYALAWCLTRSVWPALIASLWLALFVPILDVMTSALSESLYVPLSGAVLLVAGVYLQSDAPRKAWLLVLGVLLATSVLVRLVGLALVPAVGGALLARSFWRRQWGRAGAEFLMSVLALLPVGWILLINYRSTGSAYDLGAPPNVVVEIASRWSRVKLAAVQFVPNLRLGVGLSRVAAHVGSSPVALFMLMLVFALSLTLLAWRHRRQVYAGMATIGTWAHVPVSAYVVSYLAACFLIETRGAEFNSLRRLVPPFPFLIVMGVAFGHGMYRQLHSIALRGALLLVLAVFLAANGVATGKWLATARLGRGIESPRFRYHPAISFVRWNMRPRDLVFSTAAPTLWYYLRRPLRRLDAVKHLRCEDLPRPEPGGRSVFVLFPLGYDGDPTAPSEIKWLQQWASTCGTVVESYLLQEAAVHIVQPTGR